MKLPSTSTDKQLEELNQKQLFVRDALPSLWLSYSEELEEAAEALWADRDNGLELNMETQAGGTASIKKSTAHARSYILLSGLALENVLKGLLIAHNSSLITSGQLDKLLKNHKLKELADSVKDLTLSLDEQRVLEICQNAIPYWGRYPVPLRYQDLQPLEAATLAFRDSFRNLHFRLCKTLYDLIKDGWDSGVGPKTSEIRSRRYGDTIGIKKPFLWAKGDDG